MGAIQFQPIGRVRQLIFGPAVVWLCQNTTWLGSTHVPCCRTPHPDEVAPRSQLPVLIRYWRLSPNRLRPTVRRTDLSRVLGECATGEAQRRNEQADHHNPEAILHCETPEGASCRFPSLSFRARAGTLDLHACAGSQTIGDIRGFPPLTEVPYTTRGPHRTDYGGTVGSDEHTTDF